MRKRQPYDSESEGVNVREDSFPVAANQGVPDYERQRLLRIAENKKRMEALGLHKMANSLMKGSTRRSTAKGNKDKGKRKIDEDEDYNPNSEDELDDGDGDGDGDDDEDNYVNEDFASPGLAMKKKKSTSKKKKTTGKKLHVDSEFVGDDDDELMQAISLSLQGSAASPGKRNAESTIQRTKDTAIDSRRGRKKKPGKDSAARQSQGNTASSRKRKRVSEDVQHLCAEMNNVGTMISDSLRETVSFTDPIDKHLPLVDEAVRSLPGVTIEDVWKAHNLFFTKEKSVLIFFGMAPANRLEWLRAIML